MNQSTKKKMEPDATVSPETYSVGILAARLASSIIGLDQYQIESSNFAAAAVLADSPKTNTYPGFFEDIVVGIPEEEWKLATDFLNDSNLVLVRR